MPIDLYFLSISPPCRAVLMTAKHLDIEVNIKIVELLKGEHLMPQYSKLNPAKKVPTIVDGDLVLWESRAIMQYLCNKYAPNSTLYPSNPNERAIVDRWLNTDMSYFTANKEALVMKALFGIVPTDQQITNYKNSLKLIDTLIGNNKYVAGGEHLTIADLSVLATTTLLSINDFEDFNDHPNLKQWFNGLKTELPYFDEINGKVGEGFKMIEQRNKK